MEEISDRVDERLEPARRYVANSETFRFFQEEKIEEKAGYSYIGSVTL